MYRIGYEAFTFQEKDKYLFKRDPRVKLGAALLFMVYGILINDLIWALLYSIFLIIFLSILGGILKKVLKNIVVLTPLLIIIFVANYLVLYDIYRSIVPMFKLINLVMSLNIFFLTTSPDDFALTLEKLGLPLTFTLAFSLSLRFIVLLAKQLNDIIDAQLSRGFSLDKGGVIQRVKNFIPIIIPLIILSIKKSIDVAETLEVRGFRTDVKHIPYKDLKMTISDILFFTLSFMISTLILLGSYYVIIPIKIPI